MLVRLSWVAIAIGSVDRACSTTGINQRVRRRCADRWNAQLDGWVCLLFDGSRQVAMRDRRSTCQCLLFCDDDGDDDGCFGVMARWTQEATCSGLLMPITDDFWRSSLGWYTRAIDLDD